jgi:hypothetical protein
MTQQAAIIVATLSAIVGFLGVRVWQAEQRIKALALAQLALQQQLLRVASEVGAMRNRGEK